MVDWLKWCEEASEKLDRKLEDREVEFLKWVYEEHTKEEKKDTPKLKVNN